MVSTRRRLSPDWKRGLLALSCDQHPGGPLVSHRSVVVHRDSGAIEAVSSAAAWVCDRAAIRALLVFPARTPSGRYRRRIGVPAACPRSFEDCAGNAVEDAFRNRASDLSRKRSEIFSGFRAEGNRSVTIVEDPVSLSDLPVFAILRRYAISLRLRKIVPPSRTQYAALVDLALPAEAGGLDFLSARRGEPKELAGHLAEVSICTPEKPDLGGRRFCAEARIRVRKR